MKTFEKIERWLYIFDEFRFDYSRCRVHIHEMNIGEDTFACVRPCDERLGQRSMARTHARSSSLQSRTLNAKKEFSLM